MRKITVQAPNKTFEVNIEEKFEIEHMGPVEIRSALGRVSGEFAYWSALNNRLKTWHNKIKSDFESWYASKYVGVKAEKPKATQNDIRFMVMDKWRKEWTGWQVEMRRTGQAVEDCKVIVNAYEMQSKALRSAAFMVKAEWDELVREAGGDLERV